MRLGKFLDQLEALAGAVRSNDIAFVKAVGQLVGGLRPFARHDLGDAFKVSLAADTEPLDEPSLFHISRGLAPYDNFVSEIAAPGAKKAFKTFLAIVNQHSHMSIRSYLDAIHQAFLPGAPGANDDAPLREKYVKALREAQHDSARFPEVYGALIADPRVSKDDVVEIASTFAFKMSRSTSKKVALERIWKMHDASQAYVAKAKATKGKSAA
jgi:hypothetical protein